MNDYVIVRDGHLFCPQCGEQYLHQGSVAVHARHREGGAGTVVLVRAGGGDALYTDYVTRGADWPAQVHVEQRPREAMRGGYRNTLRVNFWCEGGHHVTLEIDQTKGLTTMRWATDSV